MRSTEDTMSSVINLATGAASMPDPASEFGDFPLTRQVGSTVYLGAQSPFHASTQKGSHDIEDQTRGAFAAMTAALETCDLGMGDLMKLHTYYVFDGDGEAVTRYWERMTAVRLRYLADPGPAATALRVKGAPSAAHLITIDGIASTDKTRRRLMPAHAWDWSMPTPFSQGWLVGEKVYVGGQISADRQGRAIAADDVVAQVRNTMEYIRHVLLEGNAGWSDVVSLKIAYKHDGDERASGELLDAIVASVRDLFPKPGPALNCFGVDLLYEGLVLEIDGIAVRGASKQAIQPAAGQGWLRVGGFADAVRVGDEVYVGGLSAPGGASLTAQAEAGIERMRAVLLEADATLDQLVKLDILFTSDRGQAAEEAVTLARIVGDYLPGQRPVLSIVNVAGLPHPGQRVQLSGIAVVA